MFFFHSRLNGSSQGSLGSLSQTLPMTGHTLWFSSWALHINYSFQLKLKHWFVSLGT